MTDDKDLRAALEQARLGICPVCQNRFRDDGHAYDCPLGGEKRDHRHAASATDERVAAQVRLTHHPVTNPMYCDHDSQEWPCVTELQVREGLRARLAASATEEPTDA